MTHQPIFLVIDLFCGFGGTTLGFELAKLEEIGIAKVIACVNHDPKAIQSHWLNHPEVKHYEEDIRTLDLTDLYAHVQNQLSHYPESTLILWASLECTNFSKAKGGLPRDADSRTLAIHLYRYIAKLAPDCVMIENVVEFRSWGPLDEKGKPISRKNGRDFEAWRQHICKEFDYVDEWRELNSANFGAYTSRNRLFGIFTKPWLPIAWPYPTHTKNPEKAPGLDKWKPVKEVLNFEDEGQSIFGRKKPLSDNTLERIYAGLIKYVASGDTSFISKTYSGKPKHKVISIEGPAGTITTFPNQQYLISAEFLVKYNSKKGFRYNPPSLEMPAPVITTQNRLYIASCEFLHHYYTGGGQHSSIERPYPTVTTRDRTALIEAKFLINYNHSSQFNDIDFPSPTIVTKDKLALIQPAFFIDKQYGGRDNHQSIYFPAGTILSNDKHALIRAEYFIDRPFTDGGGKHSTIDAPVGSILAVPKLNLIKCEPFILNNQFKNIPGSIRSPLGCLTTGNHHYMVAPFIVDTQFDPGPKRAKSIEDPLGVITADRHYHYIVNPGWGGNICDILSPCCTIVARQDKVPLSLVKIEKGNAYIPIYDDDSPIAVKIKQFMAEYGLIDIKMRMLRVPELLRIQGFPDNYQMIGNQSDQKKFIGNSVVPHVVKAWAEELARTLRDNQERMAV